MTLPACPPAVTQAQLGAGGEEEQERGGDPDESGLQPLPLHLHHHSGEAAAR